MALAPPPVSKYENHLRNWSADTGFPGKSRNILENTGRLATYPLFYAYQKGDITTDNFGSKATWSLNIVIFLIFTFLVIGIVLLFLSYDNNNSKAQKDAQEDTQILENLVKNYTNS